MAMKRDRRHDRSDNDRQRRRAFHIAPDKWIAAKTGAYRIELSDADGVAGIVGQWNLRVDPDSPPTISWQPPSDDLYVTPSRSRAARLAVKDNLAIQKVDLLIERPSAADGLVDQ